MSKVDFLVIESNEARAESMLSALHFLGYHPQRGEDCIAVDESTHAWRAVYVGTVADAAEAERQFALLGEAASHVPVLLANDSAWAARLCAASSPFAARIGMVEFPLRYEQLA
jgi:sigma-54 specific flagellar transcriptional regulator A